MSSENMMLPESGTEWWRASKEELAQTLVACERVRNMAEAAQAELLAEMSSRGVFATYGYATLESLQRDLLRISGSEAKKRAARAEALHPCREGTAEKPALAPLTAAAAAEGALNPGHLDALAEVMGALPADTPAEEREGYEKTLVDLAREAEPVLVRRAGRHLLARLDPDGPEPKDDTGLAEPRREFRFGWKRNNTFAFTGTLDSESGQQLEGILGKLAKPTGSTADNDGRADLRSPSERHGDAFAEMVDFVARNADLPTEGGETSTVIVSMTLAELMRRDPLITAEQATQLMFTDGPLLNWESPVTAEQARRLACDARIVPAVLGSNGEVLDLGREARTASKAQRRALALRDGGCVMCGRPPRWCHVHHLRTWLDGGPTDVINLCLLCSRCHRLVHHAGWDIRMAADGRPEAIPPDWLDPERRPRRYTGPRIDPLTA